MPIYEYECLKCKNTQDELHAFAEKVKIKCNKCGSKCKKIVSSFAFKFTGESWSYGDKLKKSMKNKNDKLKAAMRDRTDGRGTNRKQLT